MEACPKDGVKKREREKGAINMAVVLGPISPTKYYLKNNKNKTFSVIWKSTPLASSGLSLLDSE